jgi:hypothetical protein
MACKDQLKTLFRELIQQGWTIEKTPKKYKLRSPKGTLVTCSLTPSCPYAVKHIKADVKRALKTENT